MAVWYCSSVGYTAVAQWAADHVYAAGSIVRQLAAPAVGSERCFYTAAGGHSHATTEPTWVLTKAAAQPADGTVADWVECTGNTSHGWLAAHARLANALAWAPAGDTIYVSHQHASTQSTAVSLVGNGTAAAPVIVLCVNDGATPPTTLATTATITTTSTGTFLFDLFVYYYGIKFIASGTIFLCTTTAKAGYHYFASCAFVFATASASYYMLIGKAGNITYADTLIIFDNTTVKFAHVGQTLHLGGGTFLWRNTPTAIDATGSQPTVLLYPFAFTNPCACNLIELEGVDLSFLGAGKSLVTGDAAGSCRTIEPAA